MLHRVGIIDHAEWDPRIRRGLEVGVEKMNGSREGNGPAPQSPARRVGGSGDGKFCLDSLLYFRLILGLDPSLRIDRGVRAESQWPAEGDVVKIKSGGREIRSAERRWGSISFLGQPQMKEHSNTIN